MFPMGKNMFPTGKGSMDDIMKPGREAFEFWISFSPTAPLFGVEWRFGQMMLKAGAMTWSVPGTVTPTAKAPETSAAKVVDIAPRQAAKKAPVKTEAKPVAKTAPKVAAKPKPAAKAAPKPAEVKAEAPAAPPKKAAPKKPAAAKKAAPKAVKPAKATDGRPVGLLAEKPTKVDDLKLIKGIGPGLEKELNGLGVYQFEQMAGFAKADLTWIDDNLTAFKGRCFRDDWTGQAKALMG